MVHAYQREGGQLRMEFQIVECNGYEPILKKFKFPILTLGKLLKLFGPRCPHLEGEMEKLLREMCSVTDGTMVEPRTSQTELGPCLEPSS